ncbi:MAG: hypothetical protein KZQ79_16210, partial [Candidatus Thiodiazotropha sp. (ex Lucinoma borealis)]|nr:hypothetical protein [Candidatus Thiodiazotropha sp. (ex Lucinoma borealis)]
FRKRPHPGIFVENWKLAKGIFAIMCCIPVVDSQMALRVVYSTGHATMIVSITVSGSFPISWVTTM